MEACFSINYIASVLRSYTIALGSRHSIEVLRSAAGGPHRELQLWPLCSLSPCFQVYTTLLLSLVHRSQTSMSAPLEVDLTSCVSPFVASCQRLDMPHYTSDPPGRGISQSPHTCRYRCTDLPHARLSPFLFPFSLSLLSQTRQVPLGPRSRISENHTP